MTKLEPSSRPLQRRAKPEGGLVSDRVVDRILARIASGEWGPGHRLPGERQLAEEMGVSRVSVRAALQGLKTQGYLDAVQGGGTRVIASTSTMEPGLVELVRASRENLRDLAEIRCNIEVWAARRSAVNASDQQIGEMAGILAAAEDDLVRGKHKAEHDLRFHLAVAKASGSGVYMHIVGFIRGILEEQVAFHRYELFPTPADDAAILAQHRAVLDGIQRRDPQAAADAMLAHLGGVVRAFDAEIARRKSEAG
jgi:GntR family transcriptional repressor for pyruvate dehydrogenase complex